MPEITTQRLRLVTCSVEAAQAALDDRTALAARLGVHVPGDWPGADLRDFLPLYGQLVGAETAAQGWGIWLMLLPAEAALVGDIGFKGPPDAAGAVEIGYSVLPAFRRRGYAAEAARALAAWAFAQPGVQRVLAECLHDNIASIGVLERIGMRQVGRDSENIKWSLDAPSVVQ